MRGLPFSLVWAHLHMETQGLSDHVVLSQDNMVDAHTLLRALLRKGRLQKERETLVTRDDNNESIIH